MENKILDIVSIKRSIRKKHKSFIDNVGYIPDMLDADFTLRMARVSSKIFAILRCFQDEKIVDSITEEPTTSMYVSYCLSKCGYSSKINVMTDGRIITFKDLDFSIDIGMGKSFYVKKDIECNVDEYDWDEFSNDLLDYIHIVIYRRKESLGVKVFGKDFDNV